MATNEQMSTGMGWVTTISIIGIIIGLIGFFIIWPFWLGIVGIILGIIGAIGKMANPWAWISIVVGIIVAVLSIWSIAVSSPMMW